MWIVELALTIQSRVKLNASHVPQTHSVLTWEAYTLLATLVSVAMDPLLVVLFAVPEESMRLCPTQQAASYALSTLMDRLRALALIGKLSQ